MGTREPLAFETEMLATEKGLGDRDLPVSESSRRIVARSIRRSLLKEYFDREETSTIMVVLMAGTRCRQSSG